MIQIDWYVLGGITGDTPIFPLENKDMSFTKCQETNEKCLNFYHFLLPQLKQLIQ